MNVVNLSGKFLRSFLVCVAFGAATATAQGRRLRLWGTPDRPAVWELLRESGVDLINTDDLTGLRAFLTAAERMTDGS